MVVYSIILIRFDCRHIGISVAILY